MAEAAPLHRRRWPYRVLAALLLLAAVSGAGLGYFLRLDLPDIRDLQDYTPPVMSRVLATDGSLVATFAEERRMLIDYEDIPQSFLRALIATEDSSFYHHTGIDFKGILRAAWSDLRRLRLAQGASTLTQQLARNLFLHPEKTIRRKLQEVLLAIEIERQYTKQEILRFYCNQIYTGHGRYGLEAAARLYFGKPARDLDLVEAATIAGLIQRPEALSPLKHPERALERRNFVLSRMVDENYLTEEEATSAAALPLVPLGSPRLENPAPYLVEDVRRWLQQEYGSSSLYKEGLEVSTTLDVRLQEMANRAVDLGLRELDKRQGWRGVQQRVPPGADPATWESASWKLGLSEGRVTDGVVAALGKGVARVRVADRTGTLGRKQIEWTGAKDVAKLLEVGDCVRVRLRSIGKDDGELELDLEQEPRAQAALVAIDPASGAVRALVGGFDFESSEFNRATQARRQTGSAFKPLVFAAALARGWTLADTLLDEPTVFINARSPQPYQPENYTNKYYETVTLRSAMEKSANIATVKLLNQVGYDAVIETARALGIRSGLQPFPSLALGAFEISLLELTSAYATFANGGVHVEPHLVEEVRNREGVPVLRTEPGVVDALSPQTAYLMNRVLEGVITDGTGRAAAGLKMNLAGKTGTTDNNTDAWFIGYAPRLAVGVWVGFDEPASLGSRETGALAALPIWREFMQAALRDAVNDEFPVPDGLTRVTIDRYTGLRVNAAAGCHPVLTEVFVEGTEPTAYCSVHEHRKQHLPYPFQRYALNEAGALLVPRAELEHLLDDERDVYLIDGGTRLEAYTADGTISLPVETSPGGDSGALPAWLQERFDPTRWIGLDGRHARIVWLR